MFGRAIRLAIAFLALSALTARAEYTSAPTDGEVSGGYSFPSQNAASIFSLVTGDCTITGAGLSACPGLWKVSGSNYYFNTGNVGVGTTLPQTKLHVIGGTSGEQYPLQLTILEAGQTSQSVGERFCAEGTDGANIWCKGALAYQSTGTFGRGRMCLLQNSTADNSNATFANAVMCLENDGTICSSIAYNSGGTLICGARSKVAACRGDGVTDDAIALNAMIASFGGAGGLIEFPYGALCIVKQPLLATAAVRLKGPGAANAGDPANRATIRAGANIASIIGQANYTTSVGTFRLSGLIIDGNKANFTVTACVDLHAFGSIIEDSDISNCSGQGIYWREGTGGDPSWINSIRNNTIGNNTLEGLVFKGSDSNIYGNYIAGNGSFISPSVDLFHGGAVRFFGNQVEINAAGSLLRITGSDTGSVGVASIYGNYFVLSNQAIEITKGTATPSQCAFIIANNIFNANTTQDINIANDCTSGVISGNSFHLSIPSTAHIIWNGAGATGWNILGNVYRTTPHASLPAAYTVTTAGGCVFQFGIYQSGNC